MGTKFPRVGRSQGVVGAGASGCKGMEGGGAARSHGGDAPAVGEGGGRAGGAGLEAVDGARLPKGLSRALASDDRNMELAPVSRTLRPNQADRPTTSMVIFSEAKVRTYVRSSDNSESLGN